MKDCEKSSLNCNRNRSRVATDKRKICSEPRRKMGSLMRNRSGYRENVNRDCANHNKESKARVKITTRYLPCSFLVSTPWCETSLETAAGFVRTRNARGILICLLFSSNKGESGLPWVLTGRAENNRSCRRCDAWVVYPLVNLCGKYLIPTQEECTSQPHSACTVIKAGVLSLQMVQDLVRFCPSPPAY